MAYCAARTLNAYALGQKPAFVYAVMMGVIGGFWITIGMRHIYQFLRQINWPPYKLLGAIIVVIGISSMLFSFVEVWSMHQFYKLGWNLRGAGFLYRTLYDTFVLMTWTGLYFVINYHFQLQKQKEMYLAASAQAHQAQLKMLRYQLNPHFLFNTLNAISTLVLDKKNQEANDMLTKLGAFLRFSLVSQPLQKSTLDEELYALSLYLDIERVRFGDRLKIIFDITDDARKALIPSFLLQPLVENAIKYTITPCIDGGTIGLTAQIQDQRLMIRLTDDGPGFGSHPPAPGISSGVGIPNTRERLNKLYGDESHFQIINRESGGVTIEISLPYKQETPDTTAQQEVATP